MDINKAEVGKRIFTIRKSLGLTMKEFGERIGNPVASDSIVSRWEKGISVPNNERLKRIAEIGGISVNKLLHGSIENFRYSLIKELYEETVINGGVKERSPKTFDYIGGEKFINEVYDKVTELNLGYEDTESIKNQFKDMYSRKLMAYSNSLTAGDTSSYVSDFINQDDFHEKGNPVHESALKDTITCFEDCDSQIDDSDIVAIYLNNINYYENETSYRVYSKESYIAFLELRIKAFESQLEKEDLDRVTTSVFNNSIKIDKRMIEILRSL